MDFFWPLFALLAKIEADTKAQLSTGQYRFFYSKFCCIYNVYLYILHHFSQNFIRCSNRSFVEKPQMSWFEAKDHCESRGGKVFSLKIEIFFKRWKVGGN